MTEPVVRVAAIDLDETLIAGQSQQLFIRYLVKRRAAPMWVLIYAAVAFAIYKSGWHVDLATMQQRVVASFRGMPLARIDELFRDFASADLKRHVREAGLQEIERLRESGAKVILISAAIEPLAARVGTAIGIPDVLATAVTPPRNGSFSGEIDGGMLVGDRKLAAVRQHGDRVFGAGRWRLWRAYGDHESDLALLEAADEPVVVCPSSALRLHAEARGWAIQDWRSSSAGASRA